MQPSDQRFHPQHEAAWPEWVEGFRDHQIEAVEYILDAYGRGVDVVFLDAPTGSGKTLIAEMVRRALDLKAAYVCSGKDLQDQFLRDFDYARVLKGRSNYPTEHMVGYTCDDCPGASVCKWCDSAGTCPYQVAKGQAAGARVAVLNTAYFLAEASIDKSAFAKRPLKIIDECDTLEAALMNHVEFRVGERPARDLRVKLPVKSARVKTVRQSLGEVRKAAGEKLEGLKGDDIDVIRNRKRWQNLQRGAMSVANGLGEDDWGDWVRDYDDSGALILKPVRVTKQGPGKLWRHKGKWLLMSASIVSAEEMVESLGIKEAGLTWEVVTVPMTFPVENRPVFYKPAANMVYKEMRDEVPKMCDALCAVLDIRREESTLVHTVSYGLANWIARELVGRKELHGRQVLTYANAKDREGVLRRFREGGGILLAPSMERGIDLPGDLCRVNVIAKLPYPNTKDRQTAERMRGRGGQEWYAVRVARSVLQASGRATRSSSDWSETYILDKQFGGWWGQWGRRLMPRWWADAIR